MVRLHAGRGRGALGGKLSSDPASKALIEGAAVALLTGYTDPLGFLALERHDFDVAVQVVEAAQRMRREHDKSMAEYAANRTAAQLAPIMRALVVAVARAASR